MPMTGKSCCLLDLPSEIRERIYTHLFQSTTVYTDFSITPHLRSRYGYEQITDFEHYVEDDEQYHPDLNITITCRTVREETLPLFFKHALFDMTRSCTALLEKGKPNIPNELFRKFHRVHGNANALICLGLTPLPWLPPATARPLYKSSSLKVLSIDMELDGQQLCAGDSAGDHPHSFIMRKALRVPRNFQLEASITVGIRHEASHPTCLSADTRPWQSSPLEKQSPVIHVTNDLKIHIEIEDWLTEHEEKHVKAALRLLALGPYKSVRGNGQEDQGLFEKFPNYYVVRRPVRDTRWT